MYQSIIIIQAHSAVAATAPRLGVKQQEYIDIAGWIHRGTGWLFRRLCGYFCAAMELYNAV